MALSDIIVRIRAEVSAFQQSMGAVNSTLLKSEQQARKASAGFTAFGASMTALGTSLTYGVTLPLVGFGAATIKAASDMDSMKRALLQTTGSVQEAEKQFSRLKEVAKLPGIGLEEAVRGSIRLQNYGLSAALAEKALRNFSNAVAGAGGSTQDTQEALRQLGQMFGRGKVTMDNLRIILERVPQAAAIIRKEWGSEALADPAKAFEELGVSSNEMLTTLIERLGDLEKVSIGPKTAMENLRQEVTIAAARIGDHLTPTLIAVIPKLADLAIGAADAVDGFAGLPPLVQNVGLALIGLAATAGPVALVVGRVAASIEAIESAAAKASGALTTVAGGITAIGATAVAAGAAVGGLLYWLSRTPTALEQQKKAADESAESLRRINERMGNTGKSAGDMPLPFGLATDAITTFAMGLKPATTGLKEHGDEHEKTAKKVGKVEKVYKSLAIASTDMMILQERGRQAQSEESRIVRELTEITSKYEQVTVSGAERVAKSLDLLFRSYRQLSDPELIPMKNLDFKDIPKAPEVTLPVILEPMGSGDKNVGPEGMLTKEQADAIKARAKDVGKVGQAAMRQVSLVVNDLAQGITKVIFAGGKLGDMFKGIASQAAQSITRLLIEGALTKLSSKLFEVGGIMGKVFGGAGGAGGTIFSAAGSAGASAAGSAGSAVSGAVGSAASAGLTGIVSAVSGVVSAVSGVISNFQFAGMNKSLDIIVKHTLQTANDLANLRSDEWLREGHLMLKLDDLWNAIRGNGGLAVAGGGQAVNVSMAGAYFLSDAQLGDFADRLARFIKARL